MRNKAYSHSFITDLRVQFAINLANEIAEREHSSTAYECADKAVHTIFGRWLRDYSGSVRPDLMPVYLRLVCDVEKRMGLHRRRRARSSPLAPVAAARPVGLGNTEIAAEAAALVA